MKANRDTVIVLILALLLGASSGFAQEVDLQELIDFSITLRELTQSLESDCAIALSTGKYVILSGTLADITPKASRPYFFLLREDDFVDPRSFLLRIRKAADPTAEMLKGILSSENSRLLMDYDPDGDRVSAVLNPLLRDWNALLEGGLLSDQPAFKALELSDELAEILTLDPQGEDAQFVNRLILEAALPDDLLPVTVTGKIMSGEWIGTEEIRSYQGLVEFTGPDAYRVFIRRKESDATSLMIPQNSKILTMARLVRPVEGVQEEKIWLTAAVYVRRLR